MDPVLPNNKLYYEAINIKKILFWIYVVANVFSHIMMIIIAFTRDDFWTKVGFVCYLSIAYLSIHSPPYPNKISLSAIFASFKTPVFLSLIFQGNYVCYGVFIADSIYRSAKANYKFLRDTKDWKPFYTINIRRIIAQNLKLRNDNCLECSLCHNKYRMLTTRECCTANVCMSCNVQNYNTGENFDKCFQCAQKCDVRTEVYTILNSVERMKS